MSQEEEKLIDNRHDFGPENDQCEQEPMEFNVDEETVGRNKPVEKKDRKPRNKKQKMRLKKQKEALTKDQQEFEKQKEALTKDKQELTEENTRLTSEMERIKNRCLSVNQQCGAQMNAEEFISSLHQENIRLTESLQQMTSKRDMLEERCTKLSANISNNKSELSRQEDEWERVKSSWTEENEDLKNQLKQTKSSHEEELKQFRDSRHYEIEQWEISIKELRDKVVLQENLMLEKEQEVQQYAAKIQHLTSDINKMKPYYEHYQQLENERQRLDFQLRNAEETIQTLRRETLELGKEKQNLLLRLSRLAGANLTHNNPNIADLSDEKRPTKLAEEFAELYDNEWTDAFEVVDICDEKTKTTFMLELLQLANQLCHHVSTEHKQNIQRSLSTLTISMPEAEPPEKQKSDENSTDTNWNYELKGKCKVENKKLIDSMADVKSGPSQENEADQTVVDGKDEKTDRQNDGLIKDESCGPKKRHNEAERETDMKRSNQNLEGGGEKDEKNINHENESHSENNNKEDAGHKTKTAEAFVVAKEKTPGDIHRATMDGNDNTATVENQYVTKGETYEKPIGRSCNELEMEIKVTITREKDNEIKGDEDKTPTDANHGAVEDDTDVTVKGENHETQKGKISGPLKPGNNGTATKSQTGTGIETEKAQGEHEVMTTDEKDKASKSSLDETVRHSGDQKEDNLNVPLENQQNVTEYESFELLEMPAGCSGMENKERTLEADLETLNVRNEQKKAVQDIQKLVEKSLSNELQKVGAELIAKHKGIDSKKDVTVASYIQKCINICWSMCLQEPPVHVDIGVVKDDASFNTNMYKPYTKSGKYLDYIVWPALYLHKDGPMLAKGVAQGRK